MKVIVGIILAWGLWYTTLSQVLIAEANVLAAQANAIAGKITAALQ